jgi:hypothetical protein
LGTETPRDSRESPKRLESLDGLRGFAMFWIIGGNRLAQQLGDAIGWTL